jgi:hypothetical protein
MPIQLTPQQQYAIDEQGPTSSRIVDPRTNAVYVLVPEADYENVRELLEEDRQRRAIHEVALRNAAGRMEDMP